MEPRATRQSDGRPVAYRTMHGDVDRRQLSPEEAARAYTLPQGYRFVRNGAGKTRANKAERRAGGRPPAVPVEQQTIKEWEMHFWVERHAEEAGVARRIGGTNVRSFPELGYTVQGRVHDEFVCIKDNITMQARQDRFEALYAPHPRDLWRPWWARVNSDDGYATATTAGFEEFRHALSQLASVTPVVTIENVRTAMDARAPEVRARLLAHDSSAMLCSRFTYPQLGDGHEVADALRAQAWSEYVDERRVPMACLYDAVLETYKETLEEGDRAKRWLKTHSMSYEGLLPGREPGPAQLEEFVTEFFRPLRLALCVFDVWGKVVFSYHPEMDGNTANANIWPQTLRLLVHEDHVWLTRNHAQMDKLMAWDRDAGEFTSQYFDLPVRNLFPFPRPAAPQETVLLKDLRDLPGLIKRAAAGEDSVRIFWHEPDLKPLLLQIVDQMNLLPIVATANRAIRRITLKFDPNADAASRLIRGLGGSAQPKTISIESYNAMADEAHNMRVLIEQAGELETFLGCQERLNGLLLSKAHASTYGPGVVETFKEYPRNALLGTLRSGVGVEIDRRRFYTYLLENLPPIPVFNTFDVFRPYEGEAIDPHSFYIVRCPEKYLQKYPFVCDGKTMVVTGFTLQKYPRLEPRAVLRPSRLVDLTGQIRAEIAAIYASDLPDETKKHIPNIVTGMLEKLSNAKQQVYLFRDEAYAREASAAMADGRLQRYRKDLWGVVVERKVGLKNGFYPIKRLIYEMARLRMQELYDALTAGGVRVLKVNTDAVYAEAGPALKAWMGANEGLFGPERGQLTLKHKNVTIEHTSASALRTAPALAPAHVMPDVPRSRIPIRDEWDQAEFTRVFDEFADPILLTADLPGSGKSLCIQKYVQARGLKALFVCSDNALVSELTCQGFEATTVNRFFGFGIEGEDIQAVDVRRYDTVVFEEVFKCSTGILGRIREFVEGRTHRVFANGDPRQNRPIESIPHVQDPSRYYDQAMTMIFPVGIHLREMKSMADPADREVIRQLQKAMFEDRIPVKEAIQKFFGSRMVSWAAIEPAMRSVVYLNETADLLNAEMTRKEGRTLLWQEGDTALCRATTPPSKGKPRPIVNELYRVLRLTGETAGLVSQVSGAEVMVTRKQLYECFKRPYAATCHSLQGRRFEEPIVIHDWAMPLVTKEWFWTAITRARKLSQVSFCRDQRARYDLMGHIRRKVEGYRAQDRVRFETSEFAGYIDEKSVREKLFAAKLVCCHCGAHLGEAWVLDRIDANRPHTKDNIVLSCMYCNQSKSGSDRLARREEKED